MKRHLHTAVFLGLAVVLGAGGADARTKVHTYSAKLSTEGASYQGKVDVRGGDVTTIHWPDGSEKEVDENGELSHGSALAEIKNFGWVRVEIDDPSYKAENEEYVDDDQNSSGGNADQ